MLLGLVRWLTLRRKGGATLAVSLDANECADMVPLRAAKIRPWGLFGTANDGDRVYAPWASVRMVKYGARVEQEAQVSARRAEQLGEMRSAVARQVMRAFTGQKDAPKPAFSEEEIREALAADALRGPNPGPD